MTNQSLDVSTKASDELTSLKARNGDSLEIVATDSITVSYVQAGKTHSTTFNVKKDDGKIATLQDIFTKAEQIDDTSKIFADATNESVKKSAGNEAVGKAEADMLAKDTALYGAVTAAKIDTTKALKYEDKATIDDAGITAASATGTAAANVTDDLAKAISDYNAVAANADKKIDVTAFGEQLDKAAADYKLGTGASTAGVGKANWKNSDKIAFLETLSKDENARNAGDATIDAALAAYDAYVTARGDSDAAHTAVVSSATVGIDAAGDKVDTASGEKGISITANNSGIAGQISGFNISVRDSKGNVKKSANAALDAFGETIRAQNKSADNALTFQVGSNANQSIKVGLTDMRAEALGLKGADGTTLNISTQTKANAAVNVLDNALQKALDQQTTLGSVQSRLEYTSSNLTTSSTNVQSAESTIRDADMAKEMTEYTKNNVLMQAAQSMLAQANQSSSSVLSLLQ